MLQSLIYQFLLCNNDSQDEDDLVECIGDESNHFMSKYKNCILGTLTPEEEEISKDMVAAWTNFFVYGTPTPDNETRLPKLDKWNLEDEPYIIFKEKPSIGHFYKQTYPTIKTKQPTKPTDKPTTTEITPNHADIINKPFLIIFIISLIFGKFIL